MKTLKDRSSWIVMTLLMLSLVPLLVGCKAENDNPRPGSPGTLLVDISELRQQLGFPANGPLASQLDSATEPSASENRVTDEIETFILGPLTFSNHVGADGVARPYDTDKGFTKKDEDQFADDIVNVANMAVFVPFSSNIQTVELKLPEAGLGKWQVFAMATKHAFENTDQLQNTEHDDTLTYVGITKATFTSAKDLNDKNVKLRMIRACSLSDPPRGCAVYDEDGSAVVTAALEILKVIVVTDSGENTITDPSQYMDPNQRTALPPAFPWIIRDVKSADNELTPAEARTHLANIKLDANQSIREHFLAGRKQIKSIKIVTTHKLNPNEKSSCRTIVESTATVAQLEGNCQTQIYPRFYFYE
jgi:hypothetical protein